MKEKKRLSVVILTKNSADLLNECLISASWADEVIILDSGSEDDTQAIAKRHNAKFYTQTDWRGFGQQRQLAQQYAQGQYIFMLDTDERITPELKTAIQTILAKENTDQKSQTVYSCCRRNFFLGRFMRYSGWYPDPVIRLYPRLQYQYGDGDVHESLNYGSAKVVRLKGDLLHLTYRDLSSFQKKQLYYAKAWASEHDKKGKRVSFLSIFIHSMGAFVKTFLLRLGFLDGQAGLLLFFVNAQYTFNKYAILWSLQRSKNRD